MAFLDTSDVITYTNKAWRSNNIDTNIFTNGITAEESHLSNYETTNSTNSSKYSHNLTADIITPETSNRSIPTIRVLHQLEPSSSYTQYSRNICSPEFNHRSSSNRIPVVQYYEESTQIHHCHYHYHHHHHHPISYYHRPMECFCQGVLCQQWMSSKNETYPEQTKS
ncbi:hypothetical protein LOAG_13078 [Loa loa]|uniref:Uncharacterized protein n=1 Tax=Loa loa TaxID=7209 RepID=A0A1S0TK38_LOALO|nr:hypothetical protein LOAG_13078 [Loa loa]EFO15432.1 hypothetical protein LOAG_13078 [Loa loa]